MLSNIAFCLDPSITSIKDVVCHSCQVGKSKNLPFSFSTCISTKALQLIHTDVWTSPIQSVSSCKYHVVFIDDFSRFTWIYPLYTKSVVFDHFVKFKLLVGNQFSTTIKQFQFDRGGGFNSVQFQSFLKKHGIIHCKTCSHTSQQNGLAKRKLRHILETNLTLLTHSHLSNKYWVDAFLCATYIINRLPTPILEHISPYFKLYNKEPDYKALRVFGCKCYPLLCPYGPHKLNFRSKSCIFLGYHHAWYKCLDPISKKVYMSKHVIFDENSFPTKDHDAISMPSKIATMDDLTFPLLVSVPLPIFTPHIYATTSAPTSTCIIFTSSYSHA